MNKKREVRATSDSKDLNKGKKKKLQLFLMRNKGRSEKREEGTIICLSVSPWRMTWGQDGIFTLDWCKQKDIFQANLNIGANFIWAPKGVFRTKNFDHPQTMCANYDYWSGIGINIWYLEHLEDEENLWNNSSVFPT